MKLNILNWSLIFWILLLIGYTMLEFNGSLNHHLIIFSVAIFMGIIGGLDFEKVENGN